MPRKEYKKKIVPFVRAYPLLNAEQTFESMKKDAARFSGTLIKWMEFQKEYGDEDEVEYYEEHLFNGVAKAKTYQGKIYSANKELKRIDLEVEIARHKLDQARVTELMDEKTDIEEDVAGYFWRIYKIYAFIRPKIFLPNDGTKEDEYEVAEYDPEKS